MNRLRAICCIILCSIFIIIRPQIANANTDIDATIGELYRLEETIYAKWNGFRGFYTYEGQTNMNKMFESIRRIGKKYKWGVKEQINKPKQLISKKKVFVEQNINQLTLTSTKEEALSILFELKGTFCEIKEAAAWSQCSINSFGGDIEEAYLYINKASNDTNQAIIQCQVSSKNSYDQWKKQQYNTILNSNLIPLRNELDNLKKCLVEDRHSTTINSLNNHLLNLNNHVSILIYKVDTCINNVRRGEQQSRYYIIRNLLSTSWVNILDWEGL